MSGRVLEKIPGSGSGSGTRWALPVIPYISCDQLSNPPHPLSHQLPVSCESGYWKFEKWKVKWKSGSLISRSEKWNKKLVHLFQEWKVKWKCLKFEIENEKWNGNSSKSRSRVKSEMKMPRDRDREVKFLENSREILENQEIKTFQNFGPNDFHLANF